MYELLLTNKEILLLDRWIDAAFRYSDYVYNVFALGKSCGEYDVYIVFAMDIMGDHMSDYDRDDWCQWVASGNYINYCIYGDYLYTVTTFLESLWHDVKYIEDMIDVSADDIKLFNGIMDRYHIDPACRL